jgi:predicted dehydrogenase
MNLLIIGCGSIGRRHARNAKKLGAELVLCDINEALMRNLSAELGGIPYYKDYLRAVDETGVIAAVVATPSSLHVEMAIDLAKRGIHMLVEKPLSNSTKGTDVLLKIVQERSLTAMMAQSFRFHEGFLALKHLLSKNTIGKVYHVSLNSGWYLPDWHVYKDYRLEYSARRSLGGGVTLTNFSHTFDTFRWLFGEIEDILGWKTKLGSLEIDVKGSEFCLLQTEQGIIITRSSDFLSRLPKNDMIIIGSHGHILANFNKSQLIRTLSSA